MSEGRLRRLLRGQVSSNIKRMQLRLVAAAMGAIALVMTLVIVGMDVMNWYSMCDRVDEVVDLIEQAGGALANLDMSGEAPGRPSGMAWEALEEIPYDARYFTVSFGNDGEAINADLSSIASVDEPSARSMAEDVVSSGTARGFQGNYRYRVVKTDEGSMVIFLYCYDDLNYFWSSVRASVIMGLLGLAAFAAIVVPFSIKSTRPVEEAQRQQRQFVTDASHELRTPISIIGSATDVIEIESGESEWTRSIHNQTKRLESLASKLVALAKADEGSRSLKLQTIDLSEMAMGVAEDFEAVSSATQKPFSCDIDEGVTCTADASMLEQVLSILLDNAFKHSSDGAHVVLEVSSIGSGHARVRVSNEAEGYAAGEHPELFGRFYRKDESRKYSGGHGIGLAVVRAVAEAHGGKASATSDGKRLTVEFSV